MIARHFHITGRVQGVFFRSQAKDLADALGIAGWVRNAADGSVEMHAEGSDASLQKLEEWCRRGPPAATVESVIVSAASPENHESFEVRP